MVQINQEEVLLVHQETQKMLRRGAIQKVQPSLEQFLSSIFIIPKKDTGHRPVINSKKLNKHIPCEHFKMEGLFLLKEVFQKGDYMSCAKSISRCIFFSALASRISKICKVLMEGSVVPVPICPCFDLDPATKIFTKLLNIPGALLRKLMV